MFWKRVGRWALLAIAVPLAAVGARKLSQRIEARSGSTRTSRALTKTASGLDAVRGRKAPKR
jgi:hypothetical protein